nr:Do family serine endopeptidase [Bacteroidota bacterium]
MKNSFKSLAMLIVAGAIGSAATITVTNHFTKTPAGNMGRNYTPARFTGNVSNAAGVVDFTEAAASTVHGVVHVKTIYSTRQNTGFYNPFEDFFFGGPGQRQRPQQELASTGSGVIISDDGYIVTNNHVVANAEKVEITLNDNKKYEAKVIGTDPSTDLALVKIDADKLPYIPYGNSEDVKVGQWVLAVGNPFELNSTVTAGIVSAKARNINIIQGGNNPIESFIQTDAAVNPGNSGGALVNTNGELIGINTAIASNTGSYSGYSFAVPVNIVRKIVMDFIEYGAVQRGFLGIVSRQVDADLAKSKNLDDVKGVYIQGLSEDGGAKAAGLEPGDVILKVDNQDITSQAKLLETVGSKRPGDKVKVEYVREGKSLETFVTLKNKIGNTNVIKNEDIDLLGATLGNVDNDDKLKLGIENGVKIEQLNNGKLSNAGIKEGFIITSIDRQPVGDTNDVISALKNKTGGVLIEGVYPNGMRAWYGVALKD